MRIITAAFLLASSIPATALGQGCYPEFSGYYSAPFGGEMDLHPRASSATARVVSFEAMAEIDGGLGFDYIVGSYELELLNQIDAEGLYIEREEWPFETLFIQGIDYGADVNREELGEFVMHDVIVFRSEFMTASICGWRPYLTLEGIYHIRADATFRSDTFTASDR